MTMLRAALAGLVAVMCVDVSPALAQTRPLNPTVKVLDRSRSAVPAECADGLAPQPPAPRINIAEMTPAQPARAVAPPSRDLRSQLRAVQQAAESHDRAAFREALAAAKTTLSDYPNGGERDAATAAMRVYNDLDRLWTYEYETPSGSFFDASTGLVEMLSAYPGYTSSIQDQTLTLGGTKLYPSKESRDFLVREAAQRVSKLGITSSLPRVTQRETPRRESTATRPAPSTTTARKTPQTTTPRETTTSHESRSTATKKVEPSERRTTSASPSRPRTSSASGKTATRHATSTHAEATKPRERRRSSSETAPAERPRTVTAKPSPSAGSMATATTAPPAQPAPAPAPSSFGSPATETGSSTAASDTATTTHAGTTTSSVTETPVVDTAATATTDTASQTATATDTTVTTDTTATTGTPAEGQPSSRGRNVILPIVLIVIGLGVLIVLFRASS